MKSIYFYWSVLIVITLSLATIDRGDWYLLVLGLTIIKAVCVSEQFMGMKSASRLWRIPMAAYGVLVPLGCTLIIYG